MSKKIFTKEEIEILSKNEYIKNVSAKSITYTSAFRRLFIVRSNEGDLARIIFEECGFDIDIIGMKRIEAASGRWKQAYKTKGVLGLDDTRKGNSGRPLERELTLQEKYDRLEAKNNYLQAEIDLLKKLDASERRRLQKNNQLSAAEKYKLIALTIKQNSIIGMVTYLCKVAVVSRSGYYNYFSDISNKSRDNRDKLDYEVYLIIKDAFNFKRRQKGAKQIKMTLENEFNVIYNLKRIRRIMRKYNIVCNIRKANPYKRMAKATKEHTTLKNTLNREFKQDVLGKVLLTDITYLTYGNGKRGYLSAIKDASTGIIPSFIVSKNIDLSIATRTMEGLMTNKYFKPHKDAFIHSDQGVHYTSPTFQRLVKNYELGQSMSRRGNCWDNAPMESFFGHFKDECYYEKCETFEELVEEINDYMDYYNNYRCQWDLKKMTPVQYGNHLNRIAA